MKVRAYGFDWCIDEDEDEVLTSLPDELFLEVESEDEIADAVSDITGFLLYGLLYEII